MMRMLFLVPLGLLTLSGCSPDVPELEARIEAEQALDPSYPELVPLNALLADVDAVPERAAEPEGRSLEDRAEDLRRRAAELRAAPL